MKKVVLNPEPTIITMADLKIPFGIVVYKRQRQANRNNNQISEYAMLAKIGVNASWGFVDMNGANTSPTFVSPLGPGGSIELCLNTGREVLQFDYMQDFLDFTRLKDI